MEPNKSVGGDDGLPPGFGVVHRRSTNVLGGCIRGITNIRVVSMVSLKQFQSNTLKDESRPVSVDVNYT